MDAVLRQVLILRPLPQFFPCLALCGWPPPGTLECGAVRWGGGATPILPHKAGCVRVCFPLARPRDSLCHLQVFGTHRKPMVFTSLGERQPVFLSLSLTNGREGGGGPMPSVRTPSGERLGTLLLHPPLRPGRKGLTHEGIDDQSHERTPPRWMRAMVCCGCRTGKV